MRSRWSDEEAARFIERYGGRFGEDLAVRTYSARLLGAEPALVLHGGGNSSVKGTWLTVLGARVPAIYVKGSGIDMATIEPEGHPAIDLEYLLKLRTVADLTDEAMVDELRTHLFRHDSPTPSIEALVHAFLPARFIDHTHADAVLALTNRAGGGALVRDALGDEVVVLPYVTPGFKLALAVADAAARQPSARGMVWMHHGIVTWGGEARESYETMIDLVSRAERFIERTAAPRVVVAARTSLAEARRRLGLVAPIVRGLLAEPTGDADRPYQRVVLAPLVTRDVLDLVDSAEGRALALTPPLTTDHLIRTKALPAWVDAPAWEDAERIRQQVSGAVRGYEASYRAYLDRHAAAMPPAVRPFDPKPRVVLMPGLGALCAGRDAGLAAIARDITAHTLEVKATIARMGPCEGLAEAELFRMEYRTLQHAKLPSGPEPSLPGHVTIVTGAAGAIGAGICQGLLEHGSHVAVTDLAGPGLESLVAELRERHGSRVTGVPLDVTDAGSVARAFLEVVETWGGVDLVVANAGVAMVAPLADLDVGAFRRLERVNIEGTLLVLAEAGRLFRRQQTGGDIVLVSTKNVFAPGAKFGAYSATKAAAHQLARIASLEFAELGVRVNMVSPDAVFSHGARKSGLWAEVGPDRMRARGLDEAGLEAYYRDRNLLKVSVTARHVANAVLFFATRQTPTTGATVPVDGGLPDSTPR